MIRIIVLLGFVGALMFAWPNAGHAQDDVLTAARAPDPGLCKLEPRTIEEIEILVENAAASSLAASPTAVPDPFEMPAGFSLLEDELIEVEKDLTRAVSCFNTGDPMKVFATYTDRYVVELVNRLGGLSDAVVAGLTTVRSIEPADYILIINIDNALLLHDGRVLVIVAGDDPTDAAPPGPRAFYLEEVLPGRWLIDEVVEINLD